MKTINILWLFCLLIFGCKSSEEKLESEFVFMTDSKEISTVNLLKYDYGQEKMVQWKSINDMVPNKEFIVTDHFLEPSIYRIKLPTGKEGRIAVEKNGQIKIHLSNEIMVEAKIASKLNFNSSIDSLNKEFFAGMIQDFDKAMKENDQERIAELEKEKDEVLVEFIDAMENLVREMGPSAKSFDALSYFDLYKNNNFFKEMLAKFEKSFPSSGMTKSLHEKIDKADQLVIGSKIQDFKAKDRNGQEVSLADFKGSYVLLDFWASWCRPCRVENPRLLELYKSIEDVKFEIIGISIDTDEELWENAIEKDGLIWNQILDADQTIYKQYLLSSLPANFLLNKEGKIIAKNISSEEISTKLKTVTN